LKMP